MRPATESGNPGLIATSKPKAIHDNVMSRNKAEQGNSLGYTLDRFITVVIKLRKRPKQSWRYSRSSLARSRAGDTIHLPPIFLPTLS